MLTWLALRRSRREDERNLEKALAAISRLQVTWEVEHVYQAKGESKEGHIIHFKDISPSCQVGHGLHLWVLHGPSRRSYST